jgi:hypothetical protein
MNQKYKLAQWKKSRKREREKRGEREREGIYEMNKKNSMHTSEIEAPTCVAITISCHSWME